MDPRFGLSSGPVAADLVAAGLAVGVLGGGEHPAARQQCLTKQGSPEPGYQPKADLALGWWLGLFVLVYRTGREITSW
jgi:hypothetical protein